MLVYGDVEREEQASELKAELASGFRELAAVPPGLERHGRLVALFLRTAELVRGLLDAEFTESGRDDLTPSGEAGMRLLTVVANALDVSWRSDLAAPLPLAGVTERLAGLPDAAIRTKAAEGYAFYAVYPESYAEAARRCCGCR